MLQDYSASHKCKQIFLRDKKYLEDGLSLGTEKRIDEDTRNEFRNSNVF